MENKGISEAKLEYNKELVEKYPFLKWHGDPLLPRLPENRVADDDYSYTWEDELSDGWREALCPEMWDELKEILDEYGDGYDGSDMFTQIKEKYGELRVYFMAMDERLFYPVQDWAEKYSEKSRLVCICCGMPATRRTIGWISYLCDDCAKKLKMQTVPFDASYDVE